MNPTGSSIFLGILAVLFIGISKAGFGGGLGLLTTPLCVLAFGPRDAIGLLLPLLCAGDLFALRHYWRQWELRNLKLLLPGVIPGILIGVLLINRFSPRQLNVCIGLLALAFSTFQALRNRLPTAHHPFVPGPALGLATGLIAGLTSTFAHGAGPLVTLFLLPQRLPKPVFMGTTILLFTCINTLKLPFFLATGLVNPHTLTQSLLLLPLVPAGVWLGVWCNRRIPDGAFIHIILIVTFLTGLQLVFQPQITHLLGR